MLLRLFASSSNALKHSCFWYLCYHENYSATRDIQPASIPAVWRKSNQHDEQRRAQAVLSPLLGLHSFRRFAQRAQVTFAGVRQDDHQPSAGAQPRGRLCGRPHCSPRRDAHQ